MKPITATRNLSFQVRPGQKTGLMIGGAGGSDFNWIFNQFIEASTLAIE